MKICKNYEKKETENENHIIFSCNKYYNIRRKAVNHIHEVNNIELKIGNKVEKLNSFCRKFFESHLKRLDTLEMVGRTS